MAHPPASLRHILAPWATNVRITRDFIAAIPRGIWALPVPGSPRRTVRSVAVHIHNARHMWVRTLGQPHEIPVPPSLNPRSASKRELLSALRQSAASLGRVLELGCANGGRVPATAAYRWRNLALDVEHVLTYFIAHEAHHRGQLLLIARQLGSPLPARAVAAVWQWKPRPRSQ